MVYGGRSRKRWNYSGRSRKKRSYGSRSRKKRSSNGALYEKKYGCRRKTKRSYWWRREGPVVTLIDEWKRRSRIASTVTISHLFRRWVERQTSLVKKTRGSRMSCKPTSTRPALAHTRNWPTRNISGLRYVSPNPSCSSGTLRARPADEGPNWHPYLQVAPIGFIVFKQTEKTMFTTFLIFVWLRMSQNYSGRSHVSSFKRLNEFN